jgi:hypothetical protein
MHLPAYRRTAAEVLLRHKSLKPGLFSGQGFVKGPGKALPSGESPGKAALPAAKSEKTIAAIEILRFAAFVGWCEALFSQASLPCADPESSWQNQSQTLRP